MGRLCPRVLGVAHFLPSGPALTEPQASVMGMEPETCYGAGFKLRAGARFAPTELFASVGMSGCNNHFKFVLGAGVKVEELCYEIPPWRGKNHDKLINYTVRVMCRFYLFFVFNSVSILSFTTFNIFKTSLNLVLGSLLKSIKG